MRTFKFIEKSRLWFLISFIVIFIGFFMMARNAIQHKPYLNYGIDFTGGSSFMFKITDTSLLALSDEAVISRVRDHLNAFNLSKSHIQITQDNELIIKTVQLKNEQRLRLFDTLSSSLGTLELLEADVIGPSIGSELRKMSIWIIIVTSILLLLYFSSF